MANTSDAWVDEELSLTLPNIRAQGEGPNVEFKREFPRQVSDLAKEVAAFATTDGGTIFLGIEDSGDLVGLENVDNAKDRDKYINRIEGICSGSVKPAITPEVKWAVEDDYVVLAVIVPNGPEPLYYSKDVPYVRHIRSSKPADPNEVIRKVTAYMNSGEVSVAVALTGEEKTNDGSDGEISKVMPEQLVKHARELGRIVNNIEAILGKGSVRDLQFQISEMGQSLILISKDPEITDADIESAIWSIGMELHGIKNRKMYIDGGNSLRKMVREIATQNTKLQELVGQKT